MKLLFLPIILLHALIVPLLGGGGVSSGGCCKVHATNQCYVPSFWMCKEDDKSVDRSMCGSLKPGFAHSARGTCIFPDVPAPKPLTLQDKLLKNVAGISVQGGGVKSVYKFLPILYHLHKEEVISIDDLLTDTVTASTSGGSWLVNSILHDSVISPAFDEEDEGFIKQVQKHADVIADFSVNRNQGDKMGDVVNTLASEVLKPFCENVQLATEEVCSPGFIPNIVEMLSSSELNGWIQVNRNAIAHFVEDKPQREINMDWVQVTALQTGDGLGSYMPLWGVYNPKTGKREAKALKGLKASAGKFFDPEAYPDEESVQNAYEETIMTNAKDLGGPSSDFLNWAYFSKLVDSVDITLNPLKEFFVNKWSYNLTIGDEKFSTLDGAQIDGSALKSTIRFLEQKEDCSAETQTLLALMHSKDGADDFFNSKIFEGKPHLMPYGSFPESSGVKLYAQRVRTAENSFLDIKGGRDYNLLVVVADSCSNLEMLTTETGRNRPAECTRQILDDLKKVSAFQKASVFLN